MKWARKIGFNFGLTSGVITTLGLMVGLHSSTQSKIVVIGGVLTIAVADALSDSLGIHLAVESQNVSDSSLIWEATFSTFLYKFIFSSIFIIPILLLPLKKAIIVSIVMGLYIIFANSLYLARHQNVPPEKVIIEHLILTLSVIIISHLIGCGISHFFC